MVFDTLDVPEFGKWIGIQTESGLVALQNRVKEWKNTKNTLETLSSRFKKYKDIVHSDPQSIQCCQESFNKIAVYEKTLHSLIQSKTTTLEKESYNELLFLRPSLTSLNFIPMFLSIWSITRLYILPGMSFMIPFLTFIAPYILMRFIFHIPITLENYWKILYSLISGQGISANISMEGINLMKILKQCGWIFVTFIQAILQPYWTYKHMKSIDTEICEKGSLLIALRNEYLALYTLLQKKGITMYTCPIPELSSEREACAKAILEPHYFLLALRYIGSLEAILCLANQSDIQPVQWSSTKCFKLDNTYDYTVKENKRVPFSICLKDNGHALLTGPNKGGKSTVLRALSTSAVLAHTYGCAIGSTCIMSPFARMFVCLTPDDLPGEKSRFEREIEFTATTLHNSDIPTLVFIDELYHSTNPPDALYSCQVYCKQLWACNQYTSIISTHLFELVDTAPKSIKRICCPAKQNNTGEIEFQYTLCPGVSKVSSVHNLLVSNGLLLQ